MKIKIHDREYEMTEEEFAKMYERVLQDAPEMQYFRLSAANHNRGTI